jgi:predicted deacetylase
MSITSEEGIFTYETMGASEIMVFLVIPNHRDSYRCTVITRLDERCMGW